MAPSPVKMNKILRLLIHYLLTLLVQVTIAGSLQCFSCKATGNNEMDANIRCLEQAYLENCEDFYNYYNEVEGDPGTLYNFDYEEEYVDYNNGENEDQSKTSVSRESAKPSSIRKVKRAAAKEGKTSKKVKEDEKKSRSDEDEEVEYEYEYEYEDEEDEEDDDSSSSPNDDTTEDDNDDNKAKQGDEHYCYSKTEKAGWESYMVEKGCKRISYCKDAAANKPEWAHPWNFCCDRSRCNAKIVKDKPQRVYGMGCRRTDDCIQGHNGRPVCPHFFKSCPRSSYSLVKMECRVKARTMASVKNDAKYRHQFREKKCYCSKGYYPKGPICTSGFGIQIPSGIFSLVTFSATLLLQNFQ